VGIDFLGGSQLQDHKFRARDLKFGTQMHSGNTSKTRKEKSRKGAWPRSRDPINFGVHPNVYPKRVELET